MVLYNGGSSWTACRRFRDTLDGQEWFGEELLDFQYILIDVHEYTEERLLELSNLIGMVFLLERKPDIPSFMEQLQRLTRALEELPPEFFPIFQTWIKLVTNRGLSEETKGRSAISSIDLRSRRRSGT
jgi:hypothetical protein